MVAVCLGVHRHDRRAIRPAHFPRRRSLGLPSVCHCFVVARPVLPPREPNSEAQDVQHAC